MDNYLEVVENASEYLSREKVLHTISNFKPQILGRIICGFFVFFM